MASAAPSLASRPVGANLDATAPPLTLGFYTFPRYSGAVPYASLVSRGKQLEEILVLPMSPGSTVHVLCFEGSTTVNRREPNHGQKKSWETGKLTGRQNRSMVPSRVVSFVLGMLFT